MEIDKQKFVESWNALDENVDYFQQLIDKIVKENTESLDQILMKICDEIIRVDNPSSEVIEKYFLELTNCLYFMQERVEKLNIYDSLGKISYKETYNNNYMNPQSPKPKLTVAELTAYAESSSITEQSLSEMYTRVYKIVRSKIDSAQLMVQSLSKIISKRISDSQLSNRDTPFYVSNTGRQLNE